MAKPHYILRYTLWAICKVTLPQFSQIVNEKNMTQLWLKRTHKDTHALHSPLLNWKVFQFRLRSLNLKFKRGVFAGISGIHSSDSMILTGIYIMRTHCCNAFCRSLDLTKLICIYCGGHMRLMSLILRNRKTLDVKVIFWADARRHTTILLKTKPKTNLIRLVLSGLCVPKYIHNKRLDIIYIVLVITSFIPHEGRPI